MRSRCSSILLSALFVLALPAYAQPENDGADMPPPPPRAKGREVQPGTWRQPEFGSDAEGGSDRPRGRFAEPGQTMKQRGRAGGGMGGGVVGPVDLRSLNLTEDQRQKIQAQRQATVESVKQVRSNLRTVRGQLKDMMFDPNATDAQIKLKRHEVRNLQDKMDELLVNDFLKMRSVLTKEQLSHLSEIKPQARAGKDFSGHGGQGRPFQRRMPGGQFGDKQERFPGPADKGQPQRGPMPGGPEEI